MEEEIVNKVQQSGLIQLSMADFIPSGKRVEIDLKDQLWQGIALKEKEFRTWIKENDWSIYEGCFVAVHCSEDAIIPSWAYMLVSSKLTGVAKEVYCGSIEEMNKFLIRNTIDHLDMEPYKDQRVIIKGCGEPVHEDAWMAFVSKFQTVCKSIMFGEPCSTVPVYKRPK